MSFASLRLDPSLLKALKELGFAQPTPIQQDAIPAGMEGKDLLACAMTGSGKTLAFLLPVLHQLIVQKGQGTRVLVLTPTRELAAQILAELDSIAVHTPIRGAAIFGGVGMGPQEHAFRSRVDVVVATPGRLLDHLKQPYADLSGIRHLIMDEADRMLDMGFLPDIRRILKLLPVKRQTLFFSATMPGPIVELAQGLLIKPVTINLARKATHAVGITQAVYPVPQELKSSLLLELLSSDLIEQALVFTRTKHRANRLWEFLDKRGVAAARIHGGRSQPQRTLALKGFKDGTHRVLVATDIASRGIDVEALGHVVNFDVPLVPEDYIHRVGRTGRAELTGDAFTFVAPDEESDLQSIERALGKRLPRVTIPDFNYSARVETKLEIPIRERLAAHRSQRAKSRDKAETSPRESAASAESQKGRRKRPGRKAAPSASSAPAAPSRPGARPTEGSKNVSSGGSAAGSGGSGNARRRRRRRPSRGQGPSQGGGPYRSEE